MSRTKGSGVGDAEAVEFAVALADGDGVAVDAGTVKVELNTVGTTVVTTVLGVPGSDVVSVCVNELEISVVESVGECDEVEPDDVGDEEG